MLSPRATRFPLAKLLVICAASLIVVGKWEPAGAQQLNTPTSSTPCGRIVGQVVDLQTKSPLIGASVAVMGTQLGAVADMEGRFVIPQVTSGTYSLAIRSIGYEPLIKTDVVIRPKRATLVNAELNAAAVRVDSVIVTANCFVRRAEQPTSGSDFSAEEIRRSPGTAGDVSRIIAILPCIAKVDDKSNGLVVRGGNPSENGFYLDNIEIPNINHYPLMGSSGGPIGLINTDFLDDVTFSAGGFSAAYGDRLSSIMELAFRKGNRDEHDLQLDLNMAGLGLTAEGPLDTPHGSWMFSARRSFLDLLVDAIGTGIAPRYSDYQGKLAYDLSPNQSISFLGVLGIDEITFSKKQALEEGNNNYGKYAGHEYAVGLNWRSLWNRNAYSQTALSFLGTRYLADFRETDTDEQNYEENSTSRAIQLRSASTFRLSAHHELQLGFEAKTEFDRYLRFIDEYTDIYGDPVETFLLNSRISRPKGGAWVSYTVQPIERLTATFGARHDFNTLTRHAHLSPRFSWSLALSSRTSISGASGVYYQNLPLVLLSLNKDFHTFRDPRAYHFILGISHLLQQETRLTVEAYDKEYYFFPLDPAHPRDFIVDALTNQDVDIRQAQLKDIGRARAYGVELTLQKKLVHGLYGLASGSWSCVRYRDYYGTWHDRVFDNRVTFNIEGGFKPGRRYEISARWVYAGGPPYTPLDLLLSRRYNGTVRDGRRIGGARYPDYHSLNLRVDRRFFFSGSNLALYLSAWNVYNRKNVSDYYWSKTNQRPQAIYQWGFLPIIGVEYEF